MFTTEDCECPGALHWYPQRSNISRVATGLFSPIILKSDPGLVPVIYAPTSPILVTIDVSITVLDGGVGGEITLDVIPKWGTVEGTNTFLRVDSVSTKTVRLNTLCGILTVPTVPSSILIQWEAVFLPAGAEVQVNSDTTESGSHYIVSYINGLTLGQART